MEFNVPFQHKYGYIRDEHKRGTSTKEYRAAFHESVEKLCRVQHSINNCTRRQRLYSLQCSRQSELTAGIALRVAWLTVPTFAKH